MSINTSHPIRIRKELNEIIIGLAEHSDMEYRDLVAYLIAEGLNTLRLRANLNEVGEVIG
ncbi:hypothetical protein HG547_15375 [Shewanella sp. DNRA4]|uniref:Uncharacterized protein n=1 Tax=Shewanella mangrovisoli TaxID=2864211 RepID=A0ABV4VNN5_9GAMM|nr:hypothetical protein [Shewanella sp. DNRA4]NMD52985.1 hypothetical protein [Shewanella sp. DNRA4]